VGLDDLISRESAVVAAATAAVFSPRTRETLRRGAVYGVAGALKAGDVVVGATRGVVRGVRGEDASASSSNGSSRAGRRSSGGSSRASGSRRSSGSRSGSARSTGSRSGRSRSGSGRTTSRSGASA